MNLEDKPWTPAKLFPNGEKGEWYDFSKVRALPDGMVAVTNLATLTRRRRFKVWLWALFGKHVIFNDDWIAEYKDIKDGYLTLEAPDYLYPDSFVKGGE